MQHPPRGRGRIEATVLYLTDSVAGRLLRVVFGVIVVLDLVTAATVWSSWRVSRIAAVLIALVLAWLLLGSAQSWSEMTLRALGG